MLAAIRDAHVKDMGWAVCGSFSRNPTQEEASDMKLTDMLGGMVKVHTVNFFSYFHSGHQK